MPWIFKEIFKLMSLQSWWWLTPGGRKHEYDLELISGYSYYMRLKKVVDWSYL